MIDIYEKIKSLDPKYSVVVIIDKDYRILKYNRDNISYLSTECKRWLIENVKRLFFD